MPTENAMTEARATLDAVQVHHDHLDEILAAGTAMPDEVKRLNSRIGVGLKLAEVEALLAIAEAIHAAAPTRGVVRVEGNVTQEQADAIRRRFAEDDRRRGMT